MLLFLSFQNNRFSVKKKLEEDKVEQVMMNILAHPSSSWFPLFTSMLHEPPLLLPHDTARKLFLLWDCTVKHPLVKNMQLLLGNLCLNSYTTMGSPWHCRQWMAYYYLSWIYHCHEKMGAFKVCGCVGLPDPNGTKGPKVTLRHPLSRSHYA